VSRRLSRAARLPVLLPRLMRRSWSTAQISRETLERVKAEARRSGRTQLAVVETGLRLYLAEVEPRCREDALLAQAAAYARNHGSV